MSFINPPSSGGSGGTGIPVVLSDPANPFVGQIWYNASINEVIVYTLGGMQEILTTPHTPGPTLDGTYGGANALAQGYLASGTVLTNQFGYGHHANVVVVIAIWSNTGAVINSVTVGGANATLQGGLGISIGGISLYAIKRTAAAVEGIQINFATTTTAAFIALSVIHSTSFATADPEFAINHDTTQATAQTTIPAGTAGRLVLVFWVGNGGTSGGSITVTPPNNVNGAGTNVGGPQVVGQPQSLFMQGQNSGDGGSHTYQATVNASGPGPCFVGIMCIVVQP